MLYYCHSFSVEGYETNPPSLVARDLKHMFPGSHRVEQLRLRSQQRVVATVEESVLKTEMSGLES